MEMQTLNNNNQNRVLLGMSGGTDSSASAILLKEAGYQVTGVTFVFYPDFNHIHIEDARRVARQIGIEHFVYDASAIFQSEIIDYFLNEYMCGKTPVPCVKCNNQLKWPLLVQLADQMGFQYIATGHYANILSISNLHYISMGADPDKDQSFFLWGLKQNILKRIILPLGKYTKTEIRELAARKGHQRVAQKKDSMGICFCPGDYRDFLRKSLPESTFQDGYFLDSKGNILGRHAGFPFYTIGQRRGLGVQFNKPMYVKSISADKNEVVLSPLSELYKREISLHSVNYIDENDFIDEVICRVRYRKQSVLCRVYFLEDSRAKVVFSVPEHSLAPGQSAVFYIEDRVIGGGIIE